MPRNVTVDGMAVLTKRLAALPGAIEDASLRAVQGETVAVAQDLRASAPVKTGHLKDSVQSEIDAPELEGTAAVTADYAKYVVNGTSDTPANDFITPVALRSEARFRRRVQREVLAELRRITG
jgi:hypothetical protein